MTKKEYQRFNKLYNYLSNLESKRFTLKSFIDGSVDELCKRRPLSQAKACLSGYLTIVFPKDWHFVEQVVPLLREHTTGLYSKDMSLFFGIHEIEILQLTVAKNYPKPNLESVLRRMKTIAKTYGFILKRDK